MEVNNYENQDDYGSEEEQEYYATEESESDQYTSTASIVSSDDFESDDGVSYESDGDDTVYDYPYNYQEIKNSTPLKVKTTIKNMVIETVIDSGASVSLISRHLAKQLRLLPNGDTIPIASVHSKREKETVYKALGKGGANRSDVTTNVPVRIGGKLRPEHMVISDDCPGDTFILGMTWHRRYGIKTDLRTSLIKVPTKSGRNIVIQGTSTWKGADNNDVRVYNVSVRVNEDIDNDYGVENVGESLSSYIEEVLVEEVGTEAKEDEVDPSIVRIVEHIKDKYKNCFVENIGLGKVDEKYKHKIELVDQNQTVTSKPYRLTWEEDEHLKSELKELLAKGLIRPSKGKWSSPVFFVPKRPTGLRLVINYKKLNANTIKTAYPLPNISELLDSFGGSKWFSTFDAASGFWQLSMDQESIEKTGFITKYGVYEFLVMPFGLCTATNSYQSMMNDLLAPFIGKFAYVFIDDIILYSQTLEEHLEHIHTLFKVCTAANLRLKLSKCKLCKLQVEYLGHEISAKGVLPTQRNVDKILGMKTPKDVGEIRTLCGLTNYYRKYVNSYAAIMNPITKLMRKNVKFEWGDLQDQALKRVKHELTSPPLLAYPDKNMVQILTTDGSRQGLGAILSQSPNGEAANEQVVAYASKALKENEQLKYSTTHIEAYAVVWAVQYFRHYLAGSRKFILNTDHSALKYIFNSENPSAKVSRWAAALMECNYEIRYRRGKENPADALSRLFHTEK